MVVAVDPSFAKNADLYRDLEKPEEFRRYGVADSPLNASAS